MRLSQLSEPCRRLVDEMRRLKYGRIENLSFRNGQPIFDGTEEITEEFAFGKQTKQRSPQDDFELKANIVELLETLSKIRDGTISSLCIQNGLPIQMYVKKHR